MTTGFEAFEAFEADGSRFPLIFAGQAWHWVRAEVGLPKARDLLAVGGVLAPFWNRVAWGRAEVQIADVDRLGEHPHAHAVVPGPSYGLVRP